MNIVLQRGDAQLRMQIVRDTDDHRIDIAALKQVAVLGVKGKPGKLRLDHLLLGQIDIKGSAKRNIRNKAVRDQVCIRQPLTAKTDDASPHLVCHGDDLASGGHLMWEMS